MLVRCCPRADFLLEFCVERSVGCGRFCCGGGIVNRAYGTNKNLYISRFLLTIFWCCSLWSHVRVCGRALLLYSITSLFPFELPTILQFCAFTAAIPVSGSPACFAQYPFYPYPHVPRPAIKVLTRYIYHVFSCPLLSFY